MKSLLIVSLAVGVILGLAWHFRGELLLFWIAHRYYGWFQ